MVIFHSYVSSPECRAYESRGHIHPGFILVRNAENHGILRDMGVPQNYRWMVDFCWKIRFPVDGGFHINGGTAKLMAYHGLFHEKFHL